MTVPKKDREDYERGLKDRKKSTFEQVKTDILADHPGTEPYYKARRGEQLDKDKKKDE